VYCDRITLLITPNPLITLCLAIDGEVPTSVDEYYACEIIMTGI
jgi:hypothetical protein